jgi:N-methylhydantoinase A
MGILDPDDFAAGEVRLDAEAAERAFAGLDTNLSIEERIAFAYRIAATNIAEEVANVAIRHGADPRDFSLIAYGAAGPMLLPAALELMHVQRVIVPPHPGLFSALGLLSSDLVYYDSRSAYVMLAPEQVPAIAAVFEDMERRLRERAGVEASSGFVRRSFDGRLYGQSWETPFVEVPAGPIVAETLVERFHDAYERRYGNRFEYVPVQGVSYRVELVIGSEKIEFTAQEPTGAPMPPPQRRVEIRHLEGGRVDAAEYTRDSLPIGVSFEGPAVIREGLSTTLVCSRQLARVGRFGEIVIERA